jgi:fucose permease
MNLIEGFFGVGAIVGPAIVAYLVQVGASWKGVYVIAAGLCAARVIGAALAQFPRPIMAREEPALPGEALRLAGDPTALFFGVALMLYVAAEAAVYVWAPTYLAGYRGNWASLAAYAVSIFFVLRAAGRFLGVWLLAHLHWSRVLVVCSGAVAALFWIAVAGGRGAAIIALPASGLFMSVLYPTINSTGISCFDKGRHGSAAGLLLFFTCLSAVFAPLAMGALGDLLGDSKYAIALGAVFATLLVGQCAWNLAREPFAARLARRNADDYQLGESGTAANAVP